VVASFAAEELNTRNSKNPSLLELQRFLDYAQRGLRALAVQRGHVPSQAPPEPPDQSVTHAALAGTVPTVDLDRPFEWTVPYRAFTAHLDHPVHPADYSEHQRLTALIQRVLAAEAPLHRDLLARRVAELYGVSGSPRVRDAIDHHTVVRVPDPSDPRTNRQVDHVAPAELAAAIRNLVSDAYLIDQQELITRWPMRRRSAVMASERIVNQANEPTPMPASIAEVVPVLVATLAAVAAANTAPREATVSGFDAVAASDTRSACSDEASSAWVRRRRAPETPTTTCGRQAPAAWSCRAARAPGGAPAPTGLDHLLTDASMWSIPLWTASTLTKTAVITEPSRSGADALRDSVAPRWMPRPIRSDSRDAGWGLRRSPVSMATRVLP